ncbi:hypothetical protein J1614_008774 [Plenodomus biglobosus]|nr:hypothetical protein J1614_008774 [Plenodomus biglobosus]
MTSARLFVWVDPHPRRPTVPDQSQRLRPGFIASFRHPSTVSSARSPKQPPPLSAASTCLHLKDKSMHWYCQLQCCIKLPHLPVYRAGYIRHAALTWFALGWSTATQHSWCVSLLWYSMAPKPQAGLEALAASEHQPSSLKSQESIPIKRPCWPIS